MKGGSGVVDGRRRGGGETRTTRGFIHHPSDQVKVSQWDQIKVNRWWKVVTDGDSGGR